MDYGPGPWNGPRRRATVRQEMSGSRGGGDRTPAPLEGSSTPVRSPVEHGSAGNRAKARAGPTNSSATRFKLAWDVLFELGDLREGPLHLRLAGAIRDAIQSGRLPAGALLPPTRMLAKEFRCSRWVVSEAYAQLGAEGYLATRIGSGTRVRGSPGLVLPPHDSSPASVFDGDLAPILPDLSSFPVKEWTLALRAGLSTLTTDDLEFPPRVGHPHLRQILAEYLYRVRGVHADRANVTITTGTDDGLSRLLGAMRASGIDTVAVEDPGWPGIRLAAQAAGLETLSVSVDSDGLRVSELAQNSRVRAVVVTPAHQFPTGAILSSDRRAQLLAWAGRVDALIVEDDADADKRHDGRRVGAMQSADPLRVAYVASACRTLGPAVGIGWMVTPPRWTRVIHSRTRVAPCPPVMDQLAFAKLLQDGGYDRHSRRSRTKSRNRRDTLVRLISSLLPEARVSGAAAGSYFVVDVDCPTDCDTVLALQESRGLSLVSMHRYQLNHTRSERGLVIGFGNLADADFERVVSRLIEALAKRREEDALRRHGVRPEAASA
jgi:GntR family transcriptional regulator / MocR family aminotransferase